MPRYLLDSGFEVTALDSSPLVMGHAEKMKNDKLHVEVSSFEDFAFPKEEYVIATAMYSLPFCEPAHFQKVLDGIIGSLKPGGIFCGQLFGDRDEWSVNPKMTFLTIDQAKSALKGLEPVYFNEEEKDDMTAKGEKKHWHIFEFIAKKR